MYQTYLITGATGFLGRAVLQLLLAHSCRILALVMDKDPRAYMIPENATVFCGDLTDKDTLRSFFAAGGDNFCVLHCAGMVSIASSLGEIIYRVNVDGTQNIIDLWSMSALCMRLRKSLRRRRSRNQTTFRRMTFSAITEKARQWQQRLF